MKGINGKLQKMKGKKVKVVGYGIGEKGGLIPGKTKVFCCCGKGVFCCNPRNVRFPRFDLPVGWKLYGIGGQCECGRISPGQSLGVVLVICPSNKVSVHPAIYSSQGTSLGLDLE
jgi:hypothetical protein